MADLEWWLEWSVFPFRPIRDEIRKHWHHDSKSGESDSSLNQKTSRHNGPG